MQITHKPPFNYGYTPLVPRSGGAADMLMDFGVLKLKPGDKWEQASNTDEQCWLFCEGKAKIAWQTECTPCEEAVILRPNLFDYSPFCLSVPAKSKVNIEAAQGGAELFYCATENSKYFEPKLFMPKDCASERRGAGTMKETSTRIVRTCFDDTNRPQSNLVIGEVITMPGKWSSYPPHHHPQPEIYHYRFMPGNGFGLTAIGDKAYIIRDKDTILIREGEVHPQAAAPGYAMWYLWVIRHLEGAHYGPATNTPIFVDEHKWVMGDETNIWEPKCQGDAD